MLEDILVSVVIPTKNRYETLIPLLAAIKKICSKHKEIEVIIQDNSDCNEEIEDIIPDLFDNIRYFYEARWLSVVDNCDLGIKHSIGEYICLIGDDDAFTEHILFLGKYIKEKNIDACGCDYSLYRWPKATTSHNYCYEYTNHGEVIRYPDIESEMKKIMLNGIQSKANLPCVYHGLVKRSKLYQIFEKTGTFFPGPSPDMSNAFALSVITNRYIVTSLPFIIDGYSQNSTGHLSEIKKHIGKLEEQTQLPRNTIDNWSYLIPRIWLPNTIWPQSALQALKEMGRDDLISHFNYTAMYIKTYKLYPSTKNLCKEYCRKHSSLVKYFITYLRVAIVYLANTIRKHTMYRHRSIKIREQLSISEAIDFTVKLIDRENMIEEIMKTWD